ncbi:pantoate--beta-alanine ligase [Agarivorans sp. B2Z047]|uniref:pantoate--beta-alanine ligase n=1 Tax=Agarivorans sp. B2Z047 TaxID=2652721 RepID=UPI00128AE8ED|nr:pantoate--beta-alanine ligase [Agarivorans sp. B2Z047]MPW31694.1 pantoate--beta-alanine ligase [Agarivorans sp. B2Z047]UQN42346.1 pantoate--beta-alanine ligase [Agarivorans sp. B2Z047]
MLKVVEQPSELRSALDAARLKGRKVGFVPTMGNLHAGHIALVKQAQKSCDVVVVSIFVNPLQFNNSSDLANYPRTLEQDITALNQAGADFVFTPSAEVLYPNGLEAETKVTVPVLSDILEGELRPGHFDGVSTVVCKLFNLVQPHLAVFGEKDYQQLALIRKMTADLLLPIEIVGLATVREASGLAMSSRNNRLSGEQLQTAPLLAKEMRNIASQLSHSNQAELSKAAQQTLENNGFKCDGIDIVDAESLSPLTPQSRSAVILMAAFLGEVRLIDNCVIELH